MDDNQTKQLVKQAVTGDQAALETLLLGVQDMVFNLSLRMLGTVPDAEDATQEILVKVMTHLSSFRQESKFSTWVYRIAVNHLQSYRKSMFSQHPLSFEYYGMDIAEGRAEDVPDLSGGVDIGLLSQELKHSCMNVMLQCLDAQSRCIYILGTMFRLDSRIAGEIMGLTPEAYRKRLSRIRKKMADFLSEYCGESGSGICCCNKRVNYAIQNHRINPKRLDFLSMQKCSYHEITDCISAMEQMDQLSQIFADLPAYHSPEKAAGFIQQLVLSKDFTTITNAQGGKLCPEQIC